MNEISQVWSGPGLRVGTVSLSIVKFVSPDGVPVGVIVERCIDPLGELRLSSLDGESVSEEVASRVLSVLSDSGVGPVSLTDLSLGGLEGYPKVPVGIGPGWVTPVEILTGVSPEDPESGLLHFLRFDFEGDDGSRSQVGFWGWEQLGQIRVGGIHGRAAWNSGLYGSSRAVIFGREMPEWSTLRIRVSDDE